jgi:hypothetical protein
MIQQKGYYLRGEPLPTLPAKETSLNIGVVWARTGQRTSHSIAELVIAA